LPLVVEAKQTRQEEEEEEAADADAAGERALRKAAAAVVERQFRQSQEAESAAAAARLDVFPNERHGAHHRGELGLRVGFQQRGLRARKLPQTPTPPGAEPHQVLCAFEATVRQRGLDKRSRASRPDKRSTCEHAIQKYVCKECGGRGICKHGREKYYCKECGGKGICKHSRRKSKCKECAAARASASTAD
jgi:DnaJ-class molecular chaperone